MAERARRSGTAPARSRGPQSDGGVALAAIMLGVPVAVAAALAVLIKGGGIVAAFLAYSHFGSLVVLAGALLLNRPHRLPASARGALVRFAWRGPEPARVLGR